MAKWTSGPWRYKRGDSFDHGKDGAENGFEIVLSGAPESGRCRIIHRIRYAEDIFPEDGDDYVEAEANCRLIRAAPALAEAVDALLRSTDYADDDRPLMCNVREALAYAKEEK
jgi:hypothetical protein